MNTLNTFYEGGNMNNELQILEQTARYNAEQADILRHEYAIYSEKSEENERLLKLEITALMSGNDGNFICENIYHPNRVLSTISGVDYIQFDPYNERIIEAKITHPKGYNIPKGLEINGNIYAIRFVLSKKFKKKYVYTLK